MMWLHAAENSGFEMWTNVSDAVVVWFSRGLGPNETSEVAVRVLRQGKLRTFTSTDKETIARMRLKMHYAPWFPVQSQRDGWEKFVSLERVTEVRKLPTSTSAPDGPQKLTLTVTYDSRDNANQPSTETVGEVFDPTVMEILLDVLSRVPQRDPFQPIHR